MCELSVWQSMCWNRLGCSCRPDGQLAKRSKTRKIKLFDMCGFDFIG